MPWRPGNGVPQNSFKRHHFPVFSGHIIAVQSTFRHTKMIFLLIILLLVYPCYIPIHDNHPTRISRFWSPYFMEMHPITWGLNRHEVTHQPGFYCFSILFPWYQWKFLVSYISSYQFTIAVFSAGLGNSPSRALCRDPRSGGSMGLRDRMQIRHLVWLFKYIQVTMFFNGVIYKPGCLALVYIFSHVCGTLCYFVQCFNSSIDLLCYLLSWVAGKFCLS